MKDNKYYTPLVEEFHIGFEYEYKTTINIMSKHSHNWRKVIENHDSIEERYWSELVCRVKYLTKEDIESLGFGGHIPPYEYDHTWRFKEKRHIQLKAWFNEKIPKIRISDGHVIIFSGIIKNKSELKVLLKQLKIL